MQIITHSKHVRNIASTERVISGIAGGLLMTTGLARRSRLGFGLAAIGGELIRRALTGRSYAYEALGIRTAPMGQGASASMAYELGIRVDESVTIALPRTQVYRFWRHLDNLPRFMANLESVSIENATRSHWVAKGPTNRRVSWDAEIHNEIEDELLAWRSLPGSNVEHAGTVTFADTPNHDGTELTIQLQYNPPAGALGALLATIWGREPGQQIQKDLQRLKEMLESEPHGDMVEEASEESFPASDAPAYHP